LRGSLGRCLGVSRRLRRLRGWYRVRGSGSRTSG
jgi:hypothetical protein